MPYDTMTTEVNPEMKLASDVVKITFNNPRTFKEKTDLSTVNVHVTYTLKAGVNESIVKVMFKHRCLLH